MAVVQLVERQRVELDVEGSSPSSHPCQTLRRFYGFNNSRVTGKKLPFL